VTPGFREITEAAKADVNCEGKTEHFRSANSVSPMDLR